MTKSFSLLLRPGLFVLFISSILYLLPANAQQNIKFRNISIKDGLSQSSPNCIFQDHYGIVWIGTEDGLNKYDGYSFTVYKPLPDNPKSISHSRITAIVEDNGGNLWIGTNGGGLNTYLRNEDIFISCPAEHSPGKLIQCISPVGDAEIWVGSEKGLNILSIVSGQAVSANAQYPELAAVKVSVRSLLIRENTAWIGTENGLYRYSMETRLVSHFTNKLPGASNRITALLCDRVGNVVVGTEEGVSILNEQSGLFTKIDLQKNQLGNLHIKALLDDDKGNIWIATFGNGLYVGSIYTGTFANYEYDHLNPYSIKNNEVLSLLKDHSGLIWVGSNGIDIYSPGKEKFRLYDYVPYTSNQFIFRNIHPIYEDPYGFLWVGSKTDGLHVINHEQKSYTRLSVTNGLSSNRIRAIKEFPQGVLWVGTEDQGLDKVILTKDRKLQRVINYNHIAGNPNSLTSNKIYALYADVNGKLWIGTDNGLTIMDISTEDFTPYLPDTSSNKTVCNETVYAIYGARDGKIWMATDFGVNVYDPLTGLFHHFKHNKENPNSLIHNEILCFHEDGKGHMWIGTYGRGFDKYIPESNRFIHFQHVDEISTAVIYGILQDPSGLFWMSTNNGLLNFNERSGQIKQFTIEDGLQSNEFNGTSYFQSPAGEMYFGGQYGFNSFYPSDVKIDTIVPSIVLSELLIHNKAIVPGNDSPIKVHVNMAREIVLNHRQNNFTLYFSALHFANPERNQYKYKLEGFDKDWIEAGTRRFASYTNLPYKNFRFLVQASNSDGAWNKNGLVVTIKVKPPFWATIWFKILLFVAIIGLLYFIFRRRVSSAQRQKILVEEKLKVNVEKLNEAQRQLEEQKTEIVLQKRELTSRQKDQENLLWFNQGLGMLSDLISKHRENLPSLCQEFLEQLIDYVEAQQGGIFLISDHEQDTVLELISHYAFSSERVEQKFAIGEGYVGTCFKEKKFLEIDNLSEKYSQFSSGLGSMYIKYLVLAPLIVDHECIGVLEIGSFRKIKGYRITFIEKVVETFASTVFTEQANSKLKKYYEQTAEQTRELAQNEETLRMNLEELMAAQEESARREDELIKLAEEAATREEMLTQEIETLKEQIEKMKQNA